MLNNYIICDLDGCLIDSSWIWREIASMQENMTDAEKFNYFNFNACSPKCKIDFNCLVVLIYCFKIQIASKILFLTARSAQIAEPTIKFIEGYTGLRFGVNFDISFRDFNDLSAPVDSKRQRLQELLKIAQGKCLFAIDDDKKICEMYADFNIKAHRWCIGTIPVDLLLFLGGDISKIFRGGRDLICLN